jgi:hypothetical protein
MIVVAQQHHLNDQMGIKNPKIIIGFLNLTLRMSPAGNDLHVLSFSSMDIRQYLLGDIDSRNRET